MTGPAQVPVRIGHYELLLLLAQGPLGELWAAAAGEGPEQGRVVAIRRIRFGGAAFTSRQLAARAADAARSLRHPKLAAVLEVVERESELVIVSEHVEGESLAALLKQAISSKSPVQPGVAVAIARDATEALIATRDHFAKHPGAPAPFGGLVPDGLAVAAFGETMLTEPGVLAALGDAAMRGAALPYRAPEQLAEPPKSNEGTDVYGVGVLLWEMLANRSLFRSRAKNEADAEAELRKMMLSEPIPPLDSLPRQGAPLPSSLIVLVSRALFRDPKQRFQTLDQLREALDEFPRDLIAAPEQVAATLERLARNTLETRRAALTQAGEGRLSFSPESTRSTARPPGPATPVPVVVPPLGRSAGASVESFASQEAPTKPRRKLTPVSSPLPQGLSAKETPKIGSQGFSSKPPPPAAVLEPPRAEADKPVQGRESTSTGVSVLEEAGVSAEPRASSLRRFAPLIVVAVGVAAILLAVLMRSGGSDSSTPTAATGAAIAPTPAPKRDPTPTPSATATETAEPVDSAPAVQQPAPSASAARPKTRDVPQEPRPAVSGTFRPKGI